MQSKSDGRWSLCRKHATSQSDGAATFSVAPISRRPGFEHTGRCESQGANNDGPRKTGSPAYRRHRQQSKKLNDLFRSEDLIGRASCYATLQHNPERGTALHLQRMIAAVGRGEVLVVDEVVSEASRFPLFLSRTERLWCLCQGSSPSSSKHMAERHRSAPAAET